MIRKTSAAALALAMMSAAPASAEVADLATAAVSTAPTNARENGFRSDVAPGGFQLVVHGVWNAPPVAAGTQAMGGRPVPSTAATGSRALLSRPAPSSFRRASYLPHVYAAEAKFGLPAGLLDAVIWTESRYNPLAVSKAGAAGLGQLMPGTASEVGVSNRFDPLQNVTGAACYLRQMLDRFGGVQLALAAYNAGPGAVERPQGIPANGETVGYVRNVLGSWRPLP